MCPRLQSTQKIGVAKVGKETTRWGWCDITEEGSLELYVTLYYPPTCLMHCQGVTIE